MADALDGGCLCSALRYRITGEPLAASLCHCRSCRLAAGATPVAWIVAASRDFAFIAGQPACFRSSPQVVRTFCKSCGTTLTYQHDESPQTVDITTATLDDPERCAPTREVWLEHRLAWVAIKRHLAQYPRDSSEGT